MPRTDPVGELVERARSRTRLPAPEVRKAIREAAGVSLREMADAVGVTYEAIRYWENGARRPRGAHVVAYADLLEKLEEATRDA